jgi:hypothetical protein
MLKFAGGRDHAMCNIQNRTIVAAQLLETIAMIKTNPL